MDDADTVKRVMDGMLGRIDALDWLGIECALDDGGHAVLPGLLEPAQCVALAGLYAQAGRFRSRVVMERHGFGQGEYQYFGYPLPGVVQGLRTAIYPRLVPIANRWAALLRTEALYPATHAEFLDRCHAAGQRRPTPLLLQYTAGDYNCLHQDLYGEQVFPLQLAVLLSRPGEDFEGGEFVLTQSRARRQTRAEVVPLRQGDAVLFAVHDRPAQGLHAPVKVAMRHGVSQVRAGKRHTLGIIFHDAR